MIIHTGNRIPTFPEGWDPSSKEWLWISWESVLLGSTIIESTWIVPEGWVVTDTAMGQAVKDQIGFTYNGTNGALISNPTVTAGLKVTVTNHIVLSDKREYDRSVSFIISQQ